MKTSDMPIQVSSPWFRNGTLGWVLIGVGVLVWDLAAPETLTESFQRAHQHPVSKITVTTAWTVLTLHLFRKLPAPVDPMHGVTVIRRRFNHHRYEIDCCADPW